MELPDDDHLHRAVVELGDPEAFFRISRGRLAAKLALGIGLLLYGVIANYLWWVRGPATFGHFELLLLFVLPLSGASLLFHMYRNRGLYVLIYPSGLLRLRRGEVDSFPWYEVVEVRLRVGRADNATFVRDPDGELVSGWLPPDVPAFKLGDAVLIITRVDGVEAHFSPALTDFAQLAEEVQRRSFGVLWPAARARVRSGEPVSFGELEAGPEGIWYGGKLLRWRDLKEVAVAQGKLSIKQSGKWLPWALIDVISLPNPHVLFAVLEEARRLYAPPREEPKPRPAKQQEEV